MAAGSILYIYGDFLFQTLIGRLVARSELAGTITGALFQTLIGRLVAEQWDLSYSLGSEISNSYR